MKTVSSIIQFLNRRYIHRILLLSVSKYRIVMIGFKGKRTSALKDVFISIKKTNKQITGERGGERIVCARGMVE